VVEAGEAARSLLGHKVVTRATTGTYARHHTAKANDCLILAGGVSTREGAAAFISPLTAFGMAETMRRESQSALVHIAAASISGRCPIGCA
jgi:NADPH2:quinone reductase